jgi:hypothetical protein
MQDRRLEVTLLLLLALAIPVFAGTLDISRIGMGARTLALGKAQVAGLDLASVFINPANAPAIDRFSMTSMYTSLNEDVTYSMIGTAFPVMWGNYGTLGISFVNAGVSGIQLTSRDGDDRTISTSSSDYYSRLGTISYGREIVKGVTAGAALKLYAKSIDSVSQAKADGFDLDVGMLFSPREDLAVGFAIQNLLPVDLASLKWGTSAKEDIPVNFKGGVNYLAKKGLRILADYDIGNGFHGGVEWEPKDMLYLRGGADVVAVSKNNVVANLTAGLGYQFKGVSFDYAYYLDTTLNTMSSHFFSLGFSVPYREIEWPPLFMARNPASAEALSQPEQKTDIITEQLKESRR